MDGVPPTTIQKILGWSTLRMFERYAHLAPGAARAALDGLDPA